MTIHPLVRGRARRSARGMVTAETAMVLPFLVLVTVLLAWALSLTLVEVRCLDAAREGARELARGESPAQARAAAGQSAPAGATITFAPGGGQVRVVVAARAHPPIPLLPALPAVEVHASAVSAIEDTSDGGVS